MLIHGLTLILGSGVFFFNVDGQIGQSKMLHFTGLHIKKTYSGTLECDHPDNLTTLLIRSLFDRPILVFLYPYSLSPDGHSICRDHPDKVTTLLIWPTLARPKSGPIIKGPL